MTTRHCSSHTSCREPGVGCNDAVGAGCRIGRRSRWGRAPVLQPLRGPSAGERAQVTGADEQRDAEESTEAGHGLDDRGLRMLIEGGGDLSVEVLHTLVESQDVGGQLGDDARCQVFTG